MKKHMYTKLFLAFLLLTSPLRASEISEEYAPAKGAFAYNVNFVHNLNLEKGKSPSVVRLKYPYLQIQPEEKVQIVTQGAVFFMGPDSQEDVMIVGTLKPCIGIVIVNTENYHTLGFHFHWSNKIDDIINHTAKLENVDPFKLKAYIYSKETESEGAYNYDFRMGYGGRTHFVQMKYIQSYLNETLHIPNESIINVIFRRHESSHPGYLKEYMFADSCIAFKRGEEIPHNTCIMHEDIFKFSGKLIRPIDTTANKKAIIDLLGEEAAYAHVPFEDAPWSRSNIVFRALGQIENTRLIKGLDLNVRPSSNAQTIISAALAKFRSPSWALNVVPFASISSFDEALAELAHNWQDSPFKVL